MSQLHEKFVRMIHKILCRLEGVTPIPMVPKSICPFGGGGGVCVCVCVCGGGGGGGEGHIKKKSVCTH